MTMMEKVAKAIYEYGYVGDWPPKHEVDLGMDADYFRAAARAAIEAMREPSEEMMLAALRMPDKQVSKVDWPTASVTWRAMIDAALSEK